jgi:hypothetical protein
VLSIAVALSLGAAAAAEETKAVAAGEPSAPAAAKEGVAEAIAAEAEAEEVELAETLESLRVALRESVATLPELPEHIDSALDRTGAGGVGTWLPAAIGYGVAAIAVGWLANLLFQGWARRRWLSRLPTVPEELHQRVAYLLICTAIAVAGAAILGIVAWTINAPFSS